MISPARRTAFEILSALAAGRADLPAALARTRGSLRDERDQALAAEIATGVQRWRAALDHVIVGLSRRPLERLDPEIVDILRLSLYQLLHLSRVPAAAVVDDAVNLARAAGKTSAGGFVNAVLRSASRQRARLPLPGRPADPGDREAALEYLAITLSHPRWLAARWYDRLGLDAAEAWMRFDNTPAPLTLRANPFRTTALELAARLRSLDIDVAAGRFAPDALIVERGRPLAEARLDPGAFVVQDEASQLVALLAGERPGRSVLDACASPGGKTTDLAARLDAGGRVFACDVRPRRMALLQRTVRATGASNVLLVQADVRAPLPFRRSFDCVLVDAPCSGLGTLRRDPDIRWKRAERDLAALAAAQRQMLVHAAGAVAPGGRLVYATCSSEPEENEAVARAFLRESPAFTPLDARRTHTALPGEVVDDQGFLRTQPHRHGLEAFFGAVFERARADGSRGGPPEL